MTLLLEKRGRIKSKKGTISIEKKLMIQIKAVFPFIASLCIYFIALNSPMLKQMNQPQSVENEIKSIPVDEFK